MPTVHTYDGGLISGGHSPSRVRFDKCGPVVRYLESVVVGDSVRLFFERTRADGAHALCTTLVPLRSVERDRSG